MSTNNFEELNPSTLFNRILLQSGQYSSTNNQQELLLQPETEKLLLNFAELFAKELVSKSSLVTQRRQGNSIHLRDVNFVLKNQWPLYDNMSHHYRINGSMIQQFSGKPVSIIGTVSKVHPSGNVIDLETSDKQHIVVRSSDQVDINPGSIIEVLGSVDNRNQINSETILTFEPEQTANFDMDMYNQAVMLFQHYPQDYLVNL